MSKQRARHKSAHAEAPCHYTNHYTKTSRELQGVVEQRMAQVRQATHSPPPVVQMQQCR